MGQTQCPICYAPLEVRDVTPCVICGGWPDSVERFTPSAKFAEWRLPAGPVLILCQACELEEFMVPGGWGFRLGHDAGSLPINSLQFVRNLPVPVIAKDKFCAQCDLRLAFLEVVASVAD
jgi:hypothetical protein